MYLRKVRCVHPLFVAFAQVDLEFKALCEIPTICDQVPTDLLLDVLIVRLPLGVGLKNSTRGKSLRFTGLSMLYRSAHCLNMPSGLLFRYLSASYCRRLRNLRARPLPTSQDLPHLLLV